MASPLLRMITGPVLLVTLLLVQARVPLVFLLTWALISSWSDNSQPALLVLYHQAAFQALSPKLRPL